MEAIETEAGERIDDKRTEARSRAERAHLLIPVRGADRKRYLVQPRPKEERPAYYWRMDTPKWLRERYPKLPRALNRSTHTSDLKSALLRARDEIEMLLLEKHEEHKKFIEKLSGGAAPAKKRATISAVCEHFKPRLDDMEASVVTRTKSTLKLYAREVSKVQDEERIEVGDVINPNAWERFRDGREAAIAKTDDEIRRQQVRKTLRSMLSTIKSVFAPKMMRCYEDLDMPLASIEAFRKVRIGGKSTEEALGFEPWPDGFIEELEQAAELELKPTRPNVYLTYILMSRLGLRNKEVEQAKWDWLEQGFNGRTYFAVRSTRGHYRSKNKKSRSLRLSEELLATLKPYRRGPDDWIIDEPNKTDRHNVTHREINEWLRPKMAARGMVSRGKKCKCAYQLRGHAGSRVWTITGKIAEAAAFLGDTEPTTSRNYARWLKPVEALTTEQLTQRFDAVAA